MKKLGTILLLSLMACAHNKLKEGEYIIHGTVKNITQGHLYLLIDGKTDTIKVSNGKFELRSQLNDRIVRAYLTDDLNDRNIESGTTLYLEPGELTLDVHPENWKDTRLTGSKTQREQYVLDSLLQKIRDSYKTELTALEKASENYRKAAKEGKPEDVLELLKEEDYIARGRLDPYYEASNSTTLQFIKEHPESYIGLERLIYMLRDMKYEEANKIYNSFSQNLKQTNLGREVYSEIENMKKGIPGVAAGNFNSIDLNGKPIQLKDFEGRYLLIDFWASWCVPCRKGNPHLIDIYRKYHDKGLDILGVASDDNNPGAWKTAIEKDGIGIWHHVLSGLKRNDDGSYDKSNDIGEEYNISTLPTKILIGPDGIIIGRYGSGGSSDTDMDKKLEELFNN